VSYGMKEGSEGSKGIALRWGEKLQIAIVVF